MIKHVVGGIRVDDESLAVDDIAAVGAFGDFLSLDATHAPHARAQPAGGPRPPRARGLGGTRRHGPVRPLPRQGEGHPRRAPSGAAPRRRRDSASAPSWKRPTAPWASARRREPRGTQMNDQLRPAVATAGLRPPREAGPQRQPLAPLRSDFTWRFHDEAGLEPLHDATLRLLETTGMRFESPRALAILKQAGARVDEASDLVRLPRRLVEEALAAGAAAVHARRPGRRPATCSSARASPTGPPTAAAWRSSTGTPASGARPPRPTSRRSRACRTASAPSATGGRR